MKAMILAAGLGTRLLPLTRTIPKALVPFRQKPILEHLILRLKRAGITEIIINVHHFPEQIADFLKENHYFDIRIEISFEADLLDTGGGLKKAQWFFADGQPFLLHNVDVVSNLDLSKMSEYHRQKNGLATLAVRTRSTSRYLLFDTAERLIGWEDQSLQQKKITVPFSAEPLPFSFMGIHIISPGIFTQFPQAQKFSIITAYLDLAAQHKAIYAFNADGFSWADLGQLQNLRAAEQNPDF
jgi:NDP-sugar pyrophosphorylase family protein